MAQIQISQLLKDILAVLKKFKLSWTVTIVKIAVVVAATIFVMRIFNKAKPAPVPEPIRVVIHDTTVTNRYITSVLHDTVQSKPTIIERIVTRQVPPDTVIQYVPISVSDSAAFSNLYLVNRLSMKSGTLTADAVNLHTRNYRHMTFSVSDPSFDLTTNSQGVYVVEHRQFLSWDGLWIGGRYDGRFVPVIKSGLTFFQTLNLSAAMGPLTYNVDLTWKVF